MTELIKAKDKNTKNKATAKRVILTRISSLKCSSDDFTCKSSHKLIISSLGQALNIRILQKSDLLANIWLSLKMRFAENYWFFHS